MTNNCCHSLVNSKPPETAPTLGLPNRTRGVRLLYISPLHRWITQRNLAAQETQQLHQLQQQNKQLRSHIALLHNLAALEAEARKIGMVRRGEREYVVQNLPRR